MVPGESVFDPTGRDNILSCRGKILKALAFDETRRDSIIVVCKEEEQDSLTHGQGKEVIGT